MWPKENSILGWLYREFDITVLTLPNVRFPVQPSESFDWVLERIQAEYYSNAANPSLFADIEWNIEFPQQNSMLTNNNPVKIPTTLNPGIFDQTAATTRPKTWYFISPKLNWPILSRQTFTMMFENFAAAPAAVTIRTLFIGHYILPKPVIKNV